MGPTTAEIEAQRAGELSTDFEPETNPDAASEQPESPEEARAKIEQTRAEMTETIEALKTKLAPDNLIADAKTGAKEVVKGAVEGAVEATKDVAAGVAAAASHLGEQASATAANIGAAVKQAVADTGEKMNQATENMKENVIHATENVKENVQRAAETTVATAKTAGYRVSDAIVSNPLPVALVGGTLIFLYLHSKRDRIPTYRNFDSGDGNGRYPDRYQGEYTDRSITPSNSTGYNPAAYRSTSETLTGTSSHNGNSDSALAQARDKMGEIAENVKTRVSDTASMVGGKVSDVKNDLGSQAQKQVERAKTLMDEKPLLVGAAILALGAAISLLIPPTEAENRLMGQHRDRLVDQAGEKVGDLAQKAGVVAQKTLDSINESAREVLTTTTESAKHAFDTVKNAATDAVQEVRNDTPAVAATPATPSSPSRDPLTIRTTTPVV